MIPSPRRPKRSNCAGSTSPRLPAVIAHLGMPELAGFFDLADRYPSLRLDTTTVFTEFAERDWPFPRDGLGRLSDLGDRIMFGSDFPTIPYAYAEAVAALVRLNLGEDWLRAVFHHNAARLWPELAVF
jgi:predicted TIM-barrel fold metal-dependent hydrolase